MSRSKQEELPPGVSSTSTGWFCGCGTPISGDAMGCPRWPECVKKPDPSKREICGAEYTRDGKLLVCQEMPHHDPDHAMQMADRRRGREHDLDEPVKIPRGLIQRVILALNLTHEDHCVSLSNTLRQYVDDTPA